MIIGYPFDMELRKRCFRSKSLYRYLMRFQGRADAYHALSTAKIISNKTP